eukprot:scaffold156_cov25-Tisochrysis_lutea.AAC.4
MAGLSQATGGVEGVVRAAARDVAAARVRAAAAKSAEAARGEGAARVVPGWRGAPSEGSLQRGRLGTCRPRRKASAPCCWLRRRSPSCRRRPGKGVRCHCFQAHRWRAWYRPRRRGPCRAGTKPMRRPPLASRRSAAGGVLPKSSGRRSLSRFARRALARRRP